jgi:hypothetical protein
MEHAFVKREGRLSDDQCLPAPRNRKEGAVHMNRILRQELMLVLIMCLLPILPLQAWAEDTNLTYSISFTDQELDDLLAPIALYPDPLLAQILPASTYPGEVADADAWLASGGNVSSIDYQDWAEPIRAIAHYPDILRMMAENMDWTANVGDAFLNQPEDVTNAIQRLRWQARAVGNLVSNGEQTVIINGDYIQIVPAQPQYMYVPQYDASIIYVQAAPPGAPPFVTFGFGLMIGGWMSMDFDWGHHYVIYHGWDRPGWVNHARPYVHVRNVYVHRSQPAISETWRHDRSHGDPAGYLSSRPSGPFADRYARIGEVRGSTTTNPRPSSGIQGYGRYADVYSNRGRESRGVINQQPAKVSPDIGQHPALTTPSATKRPTTSPPSIGRERQKTRITDVSQQQAAPAQSGSRQQTPAAPRISGSGSSQPASARASQQPARTSSVTFGGYRGANEAKTQSLRGESSRQNIERVSSSAPPAGRSNTPAGKDTSRGRQRQ